MPFNVTKPTSGANWLDWGGAVHDALLELQSKFLAQVPGNVLIDSLTSSTDDDEMLLAARAHHRSRMGDSSTSDLAPTYRWGLRRYTHDQVFNPLNGMKLKGMNGLASSVVGSSSHPSASTQIKLAMPLPSGASNVAWIDASRSTDSSGAQIMPVGGALWDFTISDINIYSDARSDQSNALSQYCSVFRGPYVGSTQQGYRECAFHNLNCQNLYSVFGTKAEGMACTICDAAGPAWQIVNMRSQGATLQGSDNMEWFRDGCDWFNLDHTTATAPQSATGGEQWQCELRSWSKSGFAQVYFTAKNGFRALKVTGGETSFGTTIRGLRIEGNNENSGQECNGALVRFEGGISAIKDCTIDDGMAAPNLTANKDSNGATADRALIDIYPSASTSLPTTVSISEIHVAHGNTPAVSTPVVYSSGNSEVYVNTLLRGRRGQSWGTQRPVVAGNAPMNASDGSWVKV